MRNLKKSSTIIAVVFCFLNSSYVYAWNDTVTHRDITMFTVRKLRDDNWLEAYFKNNLGFQKNVSEKLPYEGEQKTILEILQAGSIEEDAWPNRPEESDTNCRSVNHFHSPIDDMGLSQGEQCLIPFFICFQLEGESALAWARGDIVSNEYSWFEARYHYRVAFEAESAIVRDRELAKTFRCLGQIMHLVQDMAVPAHTRNDMQGAGRVSVA